MRRVLVLTCLLGVLFCLPSRTAAQTATRAYYAGPPGKVQQALTLAESFRLVGDPEQADVLVLNGVIPDVETVSARVRTGAGLVLILGPQVDAASLTWILSAPVTLTLAQDPLSLDQPEGVDDPLVREVVWNSAPQVRQRFKLGGMPVLDPLARGFEDHELVLGQRVVGRGKVFVFTPFLADDANPQIQQWAYFNYLIYSMTAQAAGLSPQSFADFPGSPVPHARDREIMIILLALMVVTTLAIFFFVRRYSLRHPEALDVLVADRAEFASRERGSDWEEVGFHRPLGGFMLALMFGLVFFIPLIIYQNLILPVYILPSAQALGIWGRVVQFFNLAWMLFDLGTSTAFIKYLSQYRVHEPRRGIQYGQLFIWWQTLSGAVQVALVVILASTWVPQSAYALYAWSIIIHSLIQLPGFYEVMRHALTGLQRFDYAQILDMGLNVVFAMFTQPLIVVVMYAWGQNTPVLGAAMGGLLGLGLAAYATQLLSFLVGLWLYRRLGYGVKVLFLAHFDWDIIKSAFRFGVFDMLASAAWSVGQAAEVWITQTRLINYAEIWGNWVVAQNFVFAFQVLQTLTNNIVPAISESISQGRQGLSQYYAAQAYRYGGIASAFIGAALLAVADRFILGASGPEFTRAALYATPLILWGAIQYPSWVGDTVQLGANRPYLKAALVLSEQVVRVSLAWVLLSSLQINALIVAYFIGLLAKDFVAYFVNHRVCFPQRFYVWSSLVAPLLAGAAQYAVLRWVGGLIWQGDQVSSIVIFFIAILPSFPLFAFFYALVGGWDDDTLAELKRAADLSSFMRPLARAYWAASSLGARLSPLHGRFPIDNRPAALAEARALTAERVSL